MYYIHFVSKTGGKNPPANHLCMNQDRFEKENLSEKFVPAVLLQVEWAGNLQFSALPRTRGNACEKSCCTCPHFGQQSH